MDIVYYKVDTNHAEWPALRDSLEAELQQERPGNRLSVNAHQSGSPAWVKSVGGYEGHAAVIRSASYAERQAVLDDVTADGWAAEDDL